MDREEAIPRPTDPGEEGVPVTILLPDFLDKNLSMKALTLGITREECLLRILSEDLTVSEVVLGGVRSEIGRLSEKSDRMMESIRGEIREIDERNRKAYESLTRSITPSRKEWRLIGGGAVLIAAFMALLVFGLGKEFHPQAGVPKGAGKDGVVLPSQMGEKDKYVYFVGRWYLGVRDRMSTKERMFLENYLKPFDNFDEDLKAKKAAGL